MDRHTHTPANNNTPRAYYPLGEQPPCIENDFEVEIDLNSISEHGLSLIRKALIYYATYGHLRSISEDYPPSKKTQEDCRYLAQTIASHLNSNEYWRNKRLKTEEEMEEYYRRKNNASEEKD